MKKKIKITVLTLLTLALVGFVVDNQTSDRFQISKNLDIFATLYKEINTYYVDETKPGDLMKKGIDGMLKSLDPYTVYYPESDVEDYKFMTTGKYGGIGSKIKKIGDYNVIAEPYEGYPAFKAGLKAGDKILKVGDKDVKGISTSNLRTYLTGNPGTDVKILIERPGKSDPFTVSFKREEVKIKSVPYSGMLTDDIGYIKMTSFTQRVSSEVKDAFQGLKKKNMKALVFDLRGNPGGLLHEAVNTVNLFAPRGQLVVETRGKIETWMKEYKTLNRSIDEDIPIVVLVNGRSASASEIVSGCLQDLDRGVVIGRRTFGKGLVQTRRTLKYNTLLKVTTAKYYIPSGRCIQAIDYSKKDKNGRPMKIPDSLLTEFKTKNGRIVKDGAGILPDIEMDKNKLSAVSAALLRKNYIFNFATDFVLKNATIDSVLTFRVTDKIYDEFVSYVESDGFGFKIKADDQLNAFKKNAEKREFLAEVQTEIDALTQKLKSIKKQELIKNKKQIKKLLRREIVTRYYHQDGRIANALSDDAYVLKAIDVLNNKKEYNKILGVTQK